MKTSVTGQNIPQPRLYPGLKWARPLHTPDIVQFIPRGIVWASLLYFIITGLKIYIITKENFPSKGRVRVSCCTK